MKKAIPYIITVLLILVLGGVFCKLYFDHYMYSNKRADLDTYYGVQDQDDFPVIYENLVSEMHARRFGEACYLDLDTVRSLLNNRFYYGSEDQVLIYCLPEERISAKAGEKSWESDVNGVTEEVYAPLVVDGDTVYVALDFVRKYTNFYYGVHTGPNRLVLRNEWGTEQMATVKGSTNMRTLGGVKAPIVAAVEEGTDVLVLEDLEDWVRIETADGFYGYVESKYLSETREQKLEPVTDVPEMEPQFRKIDGRASIAWNVTSYKESNDSIDGMLVGTKGIKVLAPTWFTLVTDEGEVNCKASSTYVKNAHKKGMQVWGVLDNFQNDEGLVCTKFLHTLERRTKVISEVVKEAKNYKLDGINVDIESAGNNKFNIKIDYMYVDPDTEQLIPIQITKTAQTLPCVINTKVGIVTFSPNGRSFVAMSKIKHMKAIISNPSGAGIKYAFGLGVEPSSKTTTIANLSLNDGSVQRGIDYLNQLAVVYNRQANEDKNEIARRTDEFINDRLAKINEELNVTDGNIESYKRSKSVIHS